jgi:hypothetical protein
MTVKTEQRAPLVAIAGSELVFDGVHFVKQAIELRNLIPEERLVLIDTDQDIARYQLIHGHVWEIGPRHGVEDSMH